MEYNVTVIGTPGVYDILKNVIATTEENYYVRECDVLAISYNEKMYLAIKKLAPTTKVLSKDFCIKIWKVDKTITIDVKGKVFVHRSTRSEIYLEKYFITEQMFEPSQEKASNF